MKSKFLLFAFFIFSLSSIHAQEENTIAIAIYNFTRFVDWPANDANKDFYIDIIGHKSVHDKLKDVTAGRKVGNRNIVVRYLESVENITTSEILFLGFWQSKDIARVMDKIKNSRTLLITEKDGLIESGSAINFVIRNNVIKFEIKKGNVIKYGLVMSDNLEQMAIKTY